MSVFPDNRREQYLEKPLPSSEESERVILGAILLDNKVIAGVAAKLTPMDFYSPLNRRVFAAMLSCKALGHSIDPILVGEELKKEGSLESIGGVAAITNLTFGLPHFSNVEEYIDVVKDKAIVREVIRQCNHITATALSEEETTGKLLAEAAATFIHLNENSSELKSQSLEQVVGEVRQTFDAWKEGNLNVSSVQTGIPELDGYLKFKGLAKGELTLIGARPSTGKTAMLLQIATNVIRCNVPVLFISLEMLKQRLVMRMLPPITGIANKAINPYTIHKHPDQAEKLHDALNSIEKLPMYFDRSSNLVQLIATSEFFIQTKGVQMIVFDYLTLIKYGIISKRIDTRDAEVGMVTNELKELAIRTNTIVLGAAQMNRESEKGYGRPSIKGFRESGVIEQAVDVALFPYDPAAKEHEKDPDTIKDSVWLSLYCDKQRDGARNWAFDLYFDKNMQTLESPQMRGHAKPVPYKEEGGMRVYEKAPEPIMRDPDAPDF